MKTLAAISRPGSPAPVIEAFDIEEPREGEILVRIVASGICHTDIMMHERARGAPMILGHEGAGIVERVGAGVKQMLAGDHVVLSYGYCGQCPSCRRGANSYCDEMGPRNFGGMRPDGSSPVHQNGKPISARFFNQSSFSQFAIASENSAVLVPKDVPIELLGPLGCGILTGAGAVINAFRLRPGDSIAVFGVGSVGLSAVMAARLSGAKHIVAIDKVASRLSLARELGATHVVDATKEDAVKLIRSIAPRGIEFAFNTTTSKSVFVQATQVLAMQGSLGLVNAPEGDVPISLMMSSGQRWTMILMGDATPQLFIPMLIDLYKQGRFPFDRLVKFYPFEEVAQAFHDSEAGTTIKPILRMPH
ncbi:MAG: NAD(P)-dependent alcohol dehydrogenase [Alphaproteobacteria bacterium]